MARARKAARIAAVGAVAMFAGSGAAWAQCTNGVVGGFNFAPFAQGTAVNSIISTVGTIGLASLAQSTAFVGAPGNAQAGQQAGGVWVRTLGGDIETKNNSTSPIFTDGTRVGTVDCRSTTEQTFYATQLGFDIGQLNVGNGTNIHFGLTAGYTEVDTKDKTAGQGTFSAETQAPFAGVYAALTKGPFSADVQVRWDWIQNELRDPSQALNGQRLDADALSFLWNAAYRFDLHNNWFIEPSIGGVFTRAKVDPLEVAGTYLATGDLLGTSPGTLLIDNIKSTVGRASVRVGTTITGQGIAVQPFMVASVFREFEGEVRSSFSGSDSLIPTEPAGLPVFSGTTSTSRVGTFGHIGGGIAGVILNTGWVGYSRVDYRFGDNIDSLTFNAGLRYHFTPETSDGGMKDGGGKTDHGTYDWSGFYLGGMAGGMWGREKWTYPGSVSFNVDPAFAGYLLGGQLGYNFQRGNVVFGLEGDWGTSNARGGKGCPNGHFFTCEADVEQLALLTARLGWAHGRVLTYVKGGLAMGEVQAGAFLNPGVNPTPPPNVILFEQVLSESNWQTGWAIGGGVEFALTDRWSAKGEYMYFDLGNDIFRTGSAANSRPDVDTAGQTVRIGVNYHFGYRGHDHGHDTMK